MKSNVANEVPYLVAQRSARNSKEMTLCCAKDRVIVLRGQDNLTNYRQRTDAVLLGSWLQTFHRTVMASTPQSRRLKRVLLPLPSAGR